MTFLATLIAFLSGLISGTIGVAGGMVLLAFVLAIGLNIGSALILHAGIQLVSNLSRVTLHFRFIQWKPVAVFVLAALPTPILGLWLFEQIDEALARLLITGFILYTLWGPKIGIQKRSPFISMMTAGLLAGTLGFVVGVVGFLVAPFVLGLRISKREFLGTLAMCQMSLHLIKLIGFSSHGLDISAEWQLMYPMAMATVLGSVASLKVIDRIPEKNFTNIVKIVLTFLAFYVAINPKL